MGLEPKCCINGTRVTNLNARKIGGGYFTNVFCKRLTRLLHRNDIDSECRNISSPWVVLSILCSSEEILLKDNESITCAN